MAKAKKQVPPALPASHLEAMQAAGFEAVRYQRKSIECRCNDGSTRNEWLPMTIVNWEKRQIAEWFEAGQGNYDFAGWEASEGHTFGGRYNTVAGALGWFTWMVENRKRFA